MTRVALARLGALVAALGGCSPPAGATSGSDASVDATVDSTAVMDAPGDVSAAVTVSPTALSLPAGTKAALDVTVTGLAAPLTLTIDGLPPGVSLAPATAQGGLDGGGAHFTLTAAAGAPAGTVTALVIATDAQGTPTANVEIAITVTPPMNGVDTTFGLSGQVVLTLGEDTEASFLSRLLLLDGDQVLAVGGATAVSGPGAPKTDYVMARFSPDGLLDPSFGSSGIVVTSMPSFSDFAENGFLLPGDAGIIVGGFSHLDYDVLSSARYDMRGQIDLAYGGIVPPAVPAYSLADAGGFLFLPVNGDVATTEQIDLVDVAMQSSGTVFAGNSSDIADAGFLGRTTLTGQLDPSFGDAGWWFGVPQYVQHVISSTTDDSIYVTGAGYVAGVPAQVIAKHTVTGDLDPTFGTDGLAALLGTPRETIDTDVSAIIDASGRLLLVGTAYDGDPNVTAVCNQFMKLARFSSTGTIDPSFGQQGVAVLDLGSVVCGGGGGPRIAVDATGRIVAVTNTATGTGTVVAVLSRFGSNGVQDTTFGADGTVVYIAVPGTSTVAVDLIVQSTGGIVLGGTIELGEVDESLFLVRFQP